LEILKSLIDSLCTPENFEGKLAGAVDHM
jgi:hypothetical protein